MTDASITGDARRPLLLLPAPEPAEFASGTARGTPMRAPSRARQGERLGPRFEELQRALEAQRAELQASLIGAEPEQVLVLEVVGTVADFYRAVQRAGMEFLLEVDAEDAEPDENFAREDRPDRALEQTLYLILTNQDALDQLLSLWRRFVSGETLPHGLTKFRDVFQHLRDIRPWGPQDRVAHTGVLEEWQLLRQVQTASIPVEIELWHRADVNRQVAAESTIASLVEAAGGRVVTSTRHDEIAYHAVLAELPTAAVDQVLTSIHR